MHPQARIIPNTEHRHHAPPQRLGHTLQSTQRLERARPQAEGFRHRDGRIPDDPAILHIQPADLGQCACRCVIGSHELRDDGYRLGSVDGEAVAVVILCAELVGVVGASVPVADGVAFGAGARIQPSGVARVRGEDCGAGVGLPEVHLLAAGACAGGVGLAVDPGARVEALRVAVACAVGCAGGVEGAAAAGGFHLGEVEGAVHAAGELGGVDVEGELSVEELQLAVVDAVLGEEVHAWPQRRDLAVLYLVLTERNDVA